MVRGGGDFPSWARTKARGQRRRRQAASLSLDVVADIAARSDPVTLVRCAATCRDLRRHVADDPGFHHRLRLRHADRFVPSLLRGHLIGGLCYLIGGEAGNYEPIYLVEATAAGAVGVLCADESFPPGPDGKPLRLSSPLSARDGLVLVHKGHELRVFNLATGRSQTVPRGAEFAGHHVLLVGDGEGGDVGRPFRVVKANLVVGEIRSRLQVQIFSSELGTWGPCTQIQTPQIHGNSSRPLSGGPLVVGGAVHWLCLTNSAGYVLKLRIKSAAVAAPRLTVTRLPESFPHNSGGRIRHLLATMEAGRGRPAVLVSDGGKISAWTQSARSSRWKEQPRVVIEYEAILRFLRSVGEGRLQQQCEWPREQVNLEWFAERSGVVLLRMCDGYFFWLDLQSMEIVRWSQDTRIRYRTIYCPCEMDLTTWVPNFSSSL